MRFKNLILSIIKSQFIIKKINQKTDSIFYL